MTEQCNLIIDSCTDLPREVWETEGVQMLNFPYMQGTQTLTDDVFESLTAHDFYEGMRNGDTPSTSQLSQAIIEEAFRKAVATGIPTVYLAFSSGLSGSCDVAMMVLEHMKAEDPDLQLYVVDTLLGSTPEGVLVMEALHQRSNGLTAEQMVAWAEEARYFVHTMFMVDDLEALRRGGRIPSGVAIAGAKLDVKPLLSFDVEGKLMLVGVARGRKKGLKQLAECYLKRHSDDVSANMVIVGDSDCAKDAERVCELIEKEDAGTLFYRDSIGPTIGAHVGPGMVSISFWGGDRRDSLSVADRIAKKVKSS